MKLEPKDWIPPAESEPDPANQLIGMTSPTQESCLIGRRRVGLLWGAGELMDAEKTGRRGFASTPTGLWASGSEGQKSRRLTGEKCPFTFGKEGTACCAAGAANTCCFFTTKEQNLNEGAKP